MAAKTQQEIMDLAVTRVAMGDLKPYPKNPRRGNIQAVADSLNENGQFRPIIVQRSTKYILGGNHTYFAAKELGWKTIAAVFVDVDDERAKKIVLADNRTSDLASYDTEVLAEILDSIEMPSVGTGYSADDVNALLAAVQDNDVEAITEVIYTPPQITLGPREERDDEDDADVGSRIDDLKERAKRLTGQESVDGEDVSKTVVPEDESDKILAELQAVLEAREQQFFDSGNYWGVPDLRKDMLVEKIPDPIDTWGGKDATPDDGKTTWIYNWGLASGTGLPWDRALLAFFTYDYKFESWNEQPAYYTAKVLRNGLTQAITPDFSFWLNEPRFNHLHSTYNALWLSRFMQEAGIRIMPRIMWTDLESIKYGILGIPVGAPCIAVCIQATSDKEMEATQAHMGLREYINILKPQSLLVYSGNPGKRLVEKARLPKSLHVVHVDNYAAKRRGTVYDNPDGKEAVKRKERAAKRQEQAEKSE